MRFSYTVIFRRKKSHHEMVNAREKNRKKLECVLLIEMSVSDVEVKKKFKIIAKLKSTFMFH